MASVTLYPRADSYTPVWLTDGTGFTTASTGYVGGSGSVGVFYRSALLFQPAAIPQGSTINSATLTLTAVNNLSGVTVNLAIYGNDTDSATVVTSAGSGNSKVLTSSYVQWSPDAWTAGTSYDAPDLSTVIQELVDRSGFGSYTYIQLLIRDNGSTDKDANRDYYNYHSGINYPKLVIDFSPPSAGTYTLIPGVSADDGRWTSSTFNSGDANIFIGVSGSTYKGFFRFPNVHIPRESTVLSAYLKLSHYNSITWGAGYEPVITIKANDSDYAEAPTNYTEANALTLTTAATVWTTDGSFTAGEVLTTDDISDVVQEVIDRSEWATGNPIQFVLTNSKASYLQVSSFDDTTAEYWPQLVITYASSVATFTGDATFSLPVLTADFSASVLDAYEGDLDVTLPSPAFVGWATVKEGNACIFPALTCDATGKLGEIIEVDLPALTISAKGGQLNMATGDMDLSVMTCLAYSGTHGEMDVDAPLMTVTGTVGEGISITLPALTCSSTGVVGVSGTLTITLPALTMDSPAYAGTTGEGDIVLIALTCSASSYTVPIGTLSSTLPVAFMRATGFISDRFASTVLRYTRP